MNMTEVLLTIKRTLEFLLFIVFLFGVIWWFIQMRIRKLTGDPDVYKERLDCKHCNRITTHEVTIFEATKNKRLKCLRCTRDKIEHHSDLKKTPLNVVKKDRDF